MSSAINLYNQVSELASKTITHKYSTSFSIGIFMLEKGLRNPVRNIYGFVRLADEIVDTFHHADQAILLKELETETWRAIERGISINPVLHAFQLTVNKYQIDHNLIKAFLKSMEMDLFQKDHAVESYQQYIYGSAEVVGLMCLKVFCNGDEASYQKLKGPAKYLGAAFQKVNFLRDLKSDFDERGRLYFPGLQAVQAFDYSVKKEIEAEIEVDFKEALKGIVQLPTGARLGVYIAYVYYKALFGKIKKLKPKSIVEKRIRVSNPMKFMLLAKSYVRVRMNMI